MKDALMAIRRGDEYIEFEKAYLWAIKEYEKAYRFNPKNAELNLKIGLAYLATEEVPDQSPALTFISQAESLKPDIDKKITFYHGRAAHVNGQWDLAIEKYSEYLAIAKEGKLEKELAKTEKLIEECGYGKELSASPIRTFIDNLGKNVNTKMPEMGVVVNPDETVLYFTSRRYETTGRELDLDGYFYEDVYESRLVSGKWSRTRNLGKPVNSNGHDAVVGILPKNKQLLLYKGGGNGDLYLTTFVGKAWSEPAKLPNTVNSSHRETSGCFSPDGNILYFTSDRPGGQGGLDIYMSRRNSRMGWGKPVNLGSKINSPYDEEGVTISTDGKTLFFSSKGHSSVGGYDVFEAGLEGKEWGEPENIGLPVNTPHDELYFNIMPDGKRAYYSAYRPDTNGEKDLYMVTFLGPEKPMLLTGLPKSEALPQYSLTSTLVLPYAKELSAKLTIFKGRILAAETKTPLKAAVELSDNEQGKLIARLYSDSTSGEFAVTIPAGINYGITVKSPGYLFHSENFQIPANIEQESIEKDILLGGVTSGSKIVLNNIFFDTDKSSLRSSSLSELENIVKILEENPKIRVEISGHTDNVGNEAYNQTLSEDRAKSVVDWLVGKGVDASRLEFVGYGLRAPIADNSTEEGRQKNRRTEFKIL
ncbi:OmpA family protein [Flammeovirgaceae bacterium SG7u.111]|nr:OmpA family protein [Flammeovirgaceae bacterium SG7u.111]